MARLCVFSFAFFAFKSSVLLDTLGDVQGICLVGAGCQVISGHEAESELRVEAVGCFQSTRSLKHDSFEAETSGLVYRTFQNILAEAEAAYARQEIHLPQLARLAVKRVESGAPEKISLPVFDQLERAAPPQVVPFYVLKVRVCGLRVALQAVFGENAEDERRDSFLIAVARRSDSDVRDTQG